jgi:eukaryotic-like serine/threonine-protein kinase
MSDNTHCPTCGLELPKHGVHSFCPACLLRRALEGDAQSLSHPGEPEMTAWWNERISHGSVRKALKNAIGDVPSVLLRDTESELESPFVRASSGEMPADKGRYQIVGEIGRGGMGSVLKGRDPDLGRDLAIKVLLEKYHDDPEITRRFVEEAQIGGQLQHPGIVPVYEVGSFDDRRPYFTMKLVKGRTLAALLKERTDPARDLPRFLGIFEQVCQPMAYAHARGVIHRDLKPSNVMVGAFGEVQVMDWGLAKVLPQGGTADESRPQPDDTEISVIRTALTGSAADESQPGSVLGTPAYMSPEQASGDMKAIDERADVFGLGSILCEILTGQPAYTGPTSNANLRKAMRGETADALRRLEGCGADAELIGLAGACLAVEPRNRPRHAGEIVRGLTAYMAGVQERLRAAELARAAEAARADEARATAAAAEQARAAEEARAEAEAKGRVLADRLTREADARAAAERNRRRATVGLAASVLALAGSGGITWLLSERSSLQRHAAVVLALDEAQRLAVVARTADADAPARFAQALAALERAEGLLAQGGDRQQKREADRLKASLNADRETAQKEADWLDRLLDIRVKKASSTEGSSAEAGYAGLFREADIDPDTLAATEAAARIQLRKPVLSRRLVAALDDWAAVRRTQRDDPVAARRLRAVAQLADPDPWRNRLRTALDQPGGEKDRLKSLRELAGSARIEELPAVSLDLLGVSLLDEGDANAAADLLRKAQRVHPGDGWLKYNLARSLHNVGRTDEAIRYFMAARTIHPETAHALADALQEKGETDEAVAVFRDLTRLRPKDASNFLSLSRILKSQGLDQEARASLDAAIAIFREEIVRNPQDWGAHVRAGEALVYSGELGEGMAEYQTAIRISPAQGRNHLGRVLYIPGMLEAAIAEHRSAIRLKPDDADAHNSLAWALVVSPKRPQRDYDEGLLHARKAVELAPEIANSFNTLALAEYRSGHWDLSLAASERSTALWSGADAWDWFFQALARWQKGDRQGARKWFDKAVARTKQRDPKYVELRQFWTEAAALLGEPGPVETAAGPENHWPAVLKGDLHVDHSGIRPDATFAPGTHKKIGEVEATIALAKRWPDVLTGKDRPRDTAESVGFAHMAYDQKHFAASARIWAEALAADPKIGADRDAQRLYQASRSAILAALGKGDDEPPPDEEAKLRFRAQALDWLKADLAAWTKVLESGSARDRTGLIRAVLRWKTEADLASIREPDALKQLPAEEQNLWRTFWAGVDTVLLADECLAHAHLGAALNAEGKRQEADVEFQKAFRLAPYDGVICFNTAMVMRGQGRTDLAIELLSRAAQWDGEHNEDTGLAIWVLGETLREVGRYDDAIVTYGRIRELRRANPDDRRKADDEISLTEARRRSHAARTAALAGCGRGNDNPPSDDMARAKLRVQALDWLKSELARLTHIYGSGSGESRPVLARTLEYWRNTQDLAGVRDPESLKKLPFEEQSAWRTLWAGVDSLLEAHEPWNHIRRGEVLNAQGNREQAAAEFKNAMRLAPDDGPACFHMATVMRDEGHVDQAIELFDRAVKWEGEHLDNPGGAIWELARTLRMASRFDDAVATYRRVREQNGVGPNDVRRADHEITATEAERSLMSRLSEVIKGKPPAGTAESAALAQLASSRSLYASAARLWQLALAGARKPGDVLRGGLRYDAARAAALAASGQAKDDLPSDNAARATLRSHAIDWLKAEINSLSQALDKEPAPDRRSVARILEYWKVDPDLAGVRDADALAKLPDKEQQAWRNLWADVEALLDTAIEKGNGKLTASITKNHKASELVADSHKELGNALLKQGRLQEAIAEYREALRLKPNASHFHSTLGDVLKDHGKIEDAITEYREAVRIMPNDLRSHYFLGWILNDQGKLEEAIAEFKAANRINPDDPNPHNSLAVVLHKQGKLEEAIAEFRNAIQLKPDVAWPHSGLGDIFKEQGKQEEALAEFRQVIRLLPDDLRSHFLLGWILSDQGKLEEAIAEFKTAIRINPDDHNPHNGLATTFRKQGKLEAAFAEYREAIRLKPDAAWIHSAFGDVLKEHGQREEAVAEYREAIRLDPKDANIHSCLSWALVLSQKRPARDYAEGLVHARMAVELAPTSAICYRTLALGEYRSGHWAESMAACDRSIELSEGGQAFDWFLQAMARCQRGEKGAVRKWFDKAVAWTKERDRKNMELRQFWAEAAELLGQPGPTAFDVASPVAPAAVNPR